jgi:uncharacterized protein
LPFTSNRVARLRDGAQGIGVGQLVWRRALRGDEATTARTYARLRTVADVSLGAGWPVVVDAAFLRRSERGHFTALAALRSVPFSIFDGQADLLLLRRRLARSQARGGDAPEADATVLDKLNAAEEPLSIGASRRPA